MNRSLRTGGRVTVLALLLSFSIAPWEVTEAQTIEVVVFDGDANPDNDGAYNFTFSSAPASLSDFGMAAFATDLGTGNGEGAYRGNPSLVQEIAQTGDLVSGIPFNEFATAQQPGPAINASGTVLMHVSLGIPAVANALVIGNPSSQTLVVVEGDAAPGNGQIVPAGRGDLSDTGRVAFSANLFNTSGGSSDDDAIFRWDGSGQPLVPIVREGDPAPDANGTFFVSGGSGSFSSPSVNNAGQVAFFSEIAGSSISFDRGVFRGDGGTPTTIARVGGSAPSGGTYNDFGPGTSVPINITGQVAFHASTSAGATGVFRGDGTTTTIIALNGSIPSNAPGVTVGFPIRQVTLNDAGQVAFMTTSSGGDSGIFRGDGSGGSLIAIAYEDMPSPDGDGVFNSTFSSQDFALNNLGQVVFTASVDSTPGVAGGNEAALFFFDDALGLLKIARVGDSFLGSTFAALTFAGTDQLGVLSPNQSGLNNLGQVAFNFQLADGRDGIAMWSVPEPSTAALLLLAGSVVVRRKNGRGRG